MVFDQPVSNDLDAMKDDGSDFDVQPSLFPPEDGHGAIAPRFPMWRCDRSIDIGGDL